MFRANYPVDNPSDYWKISLYLVFLDPLVEEIHFVSKRVVSNKKRHGLLHVDRWVVSLSYHLQESTWCSNTQPHPQILLSLVILSVRNWAIYQLFQALCLEDLQGVDNDSTIYMQQPMAYTQPLQHHHYHTDNAGVIDNKREIFQCNETHEILLKVDYWVSIL
jgi:hypothetical protein